MGGKKVVHNPTGFHCVNLLVQRAVASARRKANARARGARWNDANREHISKTSSDLYYRKRDQRLTETTAYRSENREHLMEKQLVREKERRQTDADYHTTILLRSRVRGALNRGDVVKLGTTEKLVGVSAMKVRERMTQLWQDREEVYDMDHIFPFRLYRLTELDQQFKVCNVSNLQPLSQTENLVKHARLPTKAMAARVDPGCWPDGVTMDMLPDIYPGWATPLRM